MAHEYSSIVGVGMVGVSHSIAIIYVSPFINLQPDVKHLFTPRFNLVYACPLFFRSR